MLISLSAEGNATHATSNGNWNNAGTWDNGVPSCGDTIFIDSGVTVDVNVQVDLGPPGCTSPMYLEVNGTLDFNGGKKMKLPCNSYVFVSGTGFIDGSGSGSSNLIQICGITVWKTSDGDLTGPIPVGPGLPIELLEFKARSEIDLIQLSWSTASETNNDYFTIERSVDLKLFTEVLRYPGAGNSRVFLNYVAYDKNPIQGVSYYRLKQTDYDGSTTYSQPVSAKFNRASSETFRVFPSLVANGLINIEIHSEEQGEAIIELFTIEGVILFSKSIYLSEDDVLYTIDVSNIDYKGVAVFRLTSFSSSYESKLILVSE